MPRRSSRRPADAAGPAAGTLGGSATRDLAGAGRCRRRAIIRGVTPRPGPAAVLARRAFLAAGLTSPSAAGSAGPRPCRAQRSSAGPARDAPSAAPADAGAHREPAPRQPACGAAADRLAAAGRGPWPACSATWPPITGRASRPGVRRGRGPGLAAAATVGTCRRAPAAGGQCRVGRRRRRSRRCSARLATDRRPAGADRRQRAAHADCWRERGAAPGRRSLVAAAAPAGALPTPAACCTRPPGRARSPRELATPSSPCPGEHAAVFAYGVVGGTRVPRAPAGSTRRVRPGTWPGGPARGAPLAAGVQPPVAAAAYDVRAGAGRFGRRAAGCHRRAAAGRARRPGRRRHRRGRQARGGHRTVEGARRLAAGPGARRPDADG